MRAFLFVLLLATGCEAGAGVTVSREEFPQAFSEAICLLSVECTGADDSEYDACMTDYLPAYEEAFSVESCPNFDGEMADACIEEMLAKTCAGEDAPSCSALIGNCGA
jgi:hypothetical protein